MIYLDNSATTKVDETVIDAMTEMMRNLYGNPSSSHRFGLKVEHKINDCRSQIAKLIKAKSDEILFTSGGTESNNLAIMGCLGSANGKGKRIITTMIEHPSVLNVFKELENRGYDVIYLKVDTSGLIDLQMLEDSLSLETVLVSFMYINNEIGSIQDVEGLTKVIKNYNPKIVVHVDAIQVFGKYPLNMRKLGVDLMTASAHKFHGPKGVGVLYCKKDIKLGGLVHGGNQEKGIRSGTENVPGIIGLTEALKLQVKLMDDNRCHVRELKDYMINKLSSELDEITINSLQNENYSDYILSVSIKGVKGEVLLHELESKGIFISTGSACSSNKKRQFSHVLEALQMNEKLMDGTIRLSFSRYNSKKEILEALEVLIESVKSLRKIIGGKWS